MGEGEEVRMSASFPDFCRSLGLRVPPVIPPGKWVRVPTDSKPRKKNGAAKITADGRIGWAWDLAVHDAPQEWRPDRDHQPETFDPARLQAARDAAREQRRQAIAATRRCREFWASCEPHRAPVHPYLEAKGLGMEGAGALRVDGDGWLVVPAYVGSALMTVQRISPTGQKLYWPGASSKGVSFTLTRNAPRLHVVCEGLATGLAIYQAVPGTQVTVAFSTNGLLAVAENLPTGMAVVAADNDAGTEARIGTNPGVLAAQNAASAAGVGVAIPDVQEGESDWCDVRQRMASDRLTAWSRRPHTTDVMIRRAVDAEIAMQLQRAAVFRAPRED